MTTSLIVTPNALLTCLTSASGTVKKTALTDFSRPRASGIIALDLRDNDQLVRAAAYASLADCRSPAALIDSVRFLPAAPTPSLRWRQPGYDPQEHFGGVLYLYLRGMAGERTPVVDGHPTGVFSWQPPIALVEAVSDLLDGHRPETLGAR